MCRCERSVQSKTNYFSYPYFLLSFIAIFFLHSVFILHPNMTAGVCTGPECSTFIVHQTLCSSSSVSVSISVTLSQTNHQS